MTGEMGDHHTLQQQVEAMRRNDIHPINPHTTDSYASESDFYFLAPKGAYVDDVAVFSSTPGDIIKMLDQLAYTTEAVELRRICIDALERGLSLSDIEALSLDYFYDVDQGAYDKFTDHFYEPTTMTQQLELPAGWLQRVA